MASFDEALQQLREERTRAQYLADRLNQAISILEGSNGAGSGRVKRSGRRTMSADARRRIAEAQRRRWAKAKGTSKKRTLSPAARRRIVAAQKARWAKFRAQRKAA